MQDVYWNSRLQSEHARLSATIPREARVADCTCGVGPFSIPLSKRGVACYANDLNPKAVEFLRENARVNKCVRNYKSRSRPARGAFYVASRPGGRRTASTTYLRRELSCWTCFATLRCGADRPLLLLREAGNDADAIHDIHARCQNAVGASLPIPDKLLPSPAARGARKLPNSGFAVRWVRNVSPNKDMYCASFRAPSSRKRARTEDSQRPSRCFVSS